MFCNLGKIPTDLDILQVNLIKWFAKFNVSSTSQCPSFTDLSTETGLFYSKQRFPMCFLFKSTFRSLVRGHHQNSYAFLVCKNKNETSKKNTGNQE